MAPAKRKKRKGRAARFLLLALLTLLIAGFIARRTIQRLIKQDADAAASANADTGGQQGLVGGGERLHPPDDIAAGGDNGAGGGPAAASPAGNRLHSGAEKNRSGERITGSDRRQLDDLIKQKSR
ncbi:MAG TPA: hypothetical protein VGY99_07420 [Candidatus Binataceae bacterium]|nr:hypothetical protein [Candidatus Binataceae bacterium]